MKIKLIIIALALLCAPSIYGQIPVEAKNLTVHRAPAPPVRFRKAFPSAWPCSITGYPLLPYGQEMVTLTSGDFGKTWKSSGSLCVSDFTTYQLVTAKFAHAQQPAKSDSKPIALSAEASVQWIEDQRQINDLQKSITILQYQQALLAARAGVPDTYQVADRLDAEKRVVYAPPPKSEAAKTSKQ